MSNFFAELKRRHIYRVAAAYAVLAWLLIQIVNNVAPVLDLPPWVARAFLLALVIGFPVAMFFAWMREPAPAEGTTARVVTAKLDYVLASALVLVIALVSYQQLTQTRTATTEQDLNDGSARGSLVNGISIAVLPFANLSGDASQEFFSDGMTEEITSALARVPGLTVLARTSAFEFKGQNRNVRAIGEALNARYLIEGSVRKDGNRVRITAQLVQAENGANIWTENYDRQLTDLFATQEDIAQAIAVSLRVPLGLRQGEALVSNRTSDLESYQKYLQARALYRGRSISEAVSVLESAVASDPNYAPAWALLAGAYVFAPVYTLGSANPEAVRELRRASFDNAEKAAQQAIKLDSQRPGAYVALAQVQQYRRRNWTEADDLYQKALMLDSNDPDTLQIYGLWLNSIGRLKDALASRERLRTLEPFVPIYNIITAQIMQANGQNDAAIALLKTVPLDPATASLRNTFLAMAYAAKGDYGEAADMLLAIPDNANRTVLSRQSVEDAAQLLRSAPMKADKLQGLSESAQPVMFVYAHIGESERVLEVEQRSLLAETTPFSRHFWSPAFASLRKTERFKTFLRTAGLVDYWRARGWPDLCRPMGADDFVCD